MPAKKAHEIFRFRDHSKKRKIIGCSLINITGSRPDRLRFIVLTHDSCFYDDCKRPAKSRVSVKRDDFIWGLRPKKRKSSTILRRRNT